MKSVRYLVVDMLHKVDTSKAHSNELLDEAIKTHQLNEPDQRLLTRLFYGVLENRLLLDHYIGRLSKTRIEKIHGLILNALRVGIYQLVFLDQVPASAAVNESVKIAKRVNKRSAGFVNGILRNFIRQHEQGSLSLPKESASEKRLSLQYSLPLWLVSLLSSQYENNVLEQLAASNNQPPPMVLRVNTLKTDKERLKSDLARIGIETRESAHAVDGLIVVKTGATGLTQNLLFNEGFYYIQDEASMMVAQILSPKPGETVYDLCAAPGGKTTHIAQLMGRHGIIYAFDLYGQRVKSITMNANRLGIENIEEIVKDSSLYDPSLENGADRILVDVPCSGLGILRRKPELRYRINHEDLHDLISIQKKILHNAAAYLKKGGFLVYSTCTLNYNENDKIILDFLGEHKGFSLVDINKGAYPSLSRKNLPCIEESIHTYPHRDQTDGFFISMIQKT